MHLTPAERRHAVLTSRVAWLREMSEDVTLPLSRVERTLLRMVADKVALVARQLLLPGGSCEPKRS